MSQSPLTTQVEHALADTAWRMLGALGMSTSERADTPFSIEPEAALVLAAMSNDARLHEEARDWLATYTDLVSKPVLKRRVGHLRPADTERWIDFAGPAASHVTGALPLIPPGGRSDWTPTKRTIRGKYIEYTPAWSHLRYRAIFGTQARATILLLLAEPRSDRGWMADAIARTSGYAKHSVREALHRLAEGGVVRVVRVSNTDWFSAVDHTRITALAGQPVRPAVDIEYVIHGFSILKAAAEALATGSTNAGPVIAHDHLHRANDVLATLHLDPPRANTDPHQLGVEISAFIDRACERLSGTHRSLWPW